MAEEATQTETEVAAEETPEVETPTVETPETPQHWSRTEGMGFDDDTVGWLENKGFETPQDAVTAQRALEKKLGGPSEMLQLWPESDDEEGLKAIHRRLGCPEDVEGYKVEFEEGAPIDADTLSWFKGVALSHNMTNAQVQGMALDWNTEVARIQAEQQQALEVRDQTERVELENAWGSKLDERLDYGHRALLANGLVEEDIDAIQAVIGPKKLAQWAAKMADTMGEDTIAANTTTPAFGTSKEQIKNQIDDLDAEIAADPERLAKLRVDSGEGVLKETTGKDFRKREALWAQLREVIKAEKGGI